jgi:hypothetical protein
LNCSVCNGIGMVLVFCRWLELFFMGCYYVNSSNFHLNYSFFNDGSPVSVCRCWQQFLIFVIRVWKESMHNVNKRVATSQESFWPLAWMFTATAIRKFGQKPTKKSSNTTCDVPCSTQESMSIIDKGMKPYSPRRQK